MCPNINNENVRNQFNSIIKAFGGAPMTIEEFKSKELRNQRSGVDDSAMQIAYSVWAKTNGEPSIGANIRQSVNEMLGVGQDADSKDIAFENMELKGVSEIFADLMAPYEKGINTIRSKYKIPDGRTALMSKMLYAKLVKKYNENEKMPYEIVHNGIIIKNRDFAGQNDFEVTIRVKKDFIDALQRSAERRFNEQAKAIADSDPLEAEQEMTPFQKASMAAIEITHQDARKGHSKARGGTQLSLFDSLLMSQEKVAKKASKRAIAVFVKIAEDMTKRFGVKFEIATEAEADYIRAKNGRKVGPGYRTAGFFLNGTAYLVEGVFNGATAVHEIFGHPFLNALKRDPSLHELYNQLLVEAGKDKNAVKYIDAAYDGHSDSIKGDELILYVLGGMIDERISAELNKNVLERFFTELGKYINKIFKKNTNLNYFGPRLGLNDMADWLLYGNGSMKLVAPSNKEGVLEASASILKAIGSDGIKSINSGYLDFSNIRNAHNKDYFEAFHRFIEEFGAINEDFILNNINSRLGWVVTENGAAKIFNLHGELSESSPMTTVDGRTAYVFDSETTSLPDILTLMSGSVDNILIYHRYANLLYDAVSKYVPYQSITIYTGSDGVKYLAYSPSVMKMNSPVIESDMLESRVSFTDISTHNEQAFIDKIRDGLKAQLHALERKGSHEVESIDRVKSLIRDIDMYDTMTMLMKFVDNAAKEVSEVRMNVDKMTSAMANGSEVDSGALNDIKKNFLTLYTSTIDTIFQLKSDFNGPISSMPKADRNAFEEKLNDVSLGLKEIEAAMNNLIKYAYSNKLIEIGEGAGSTTISDSVGNNAYLEDSDISLLSVAIGASVLNKKEQIRILDKMIRDTQAKTVRQVENDGVVENLYAKWMAVKAKNPLATYSPIMEFEDGKATGFILSDLKYGRFNKEYNKFISKLREKYGVSDFDGTPENEDDAHKFELEKEEWLAKNVERRFTEEYYRIKKSLSPYAKSLLDEADEEVRVYVNKFRDEDGHFRPDRMTDRQKDILEERRKRRRAVSSMVYADGTPKQEGTMDYNAALEIIEMNKKLYKNVRYTSNYDAFNAARDKMKATLSSDQFARWEMENTRVVYSDEFWRMLSNLERAEQSPQWNRLYEIRSSLLKIHRDPNTMEVSGISISKNNQISEEIKKIDKWLSDNKINPGNYSNSFSDFAEIIPTAEYNRLEAEYASKANTPEGKLEYEKFLKDTHYINSNGYSTLYSHWSKLAPKDPSMIRREPNSIWSELDESSPWFNKNFDKSKETWGMQPKRAVYDNSAEFNKLAKNKEMLEFRNALVDSYAAANKKYSYIRRINPLKLASIPGGFWHKVTHGSGDKFMSGLREAIADEFVYREFDAGLGDYDTKDMFNADGSPVMVVPTKFVTQMANPNAISRDLMESFIFYYKAAVNFENMSKKASDFELLLEGIRKTEVSDKRGGVKKVSGETNMYSKAKDLVYSEVYGRQNVNKYEFIIGRGGFADKVMNGARRMLGKEQRSYENMYGTFSVAKVWFTRILPAIKAVNLSGNIKAIFSNFAGAAIHQKIEASAGIYMTNKTYMLGNLEAIKNIPNSVQSVMSRNGSKMVSMMRYFGISRSNEADMANLHGSRLSRALATQIWYGPYSAGDFAIKSTSMVAVMLNIKPFEGKFYQREQFISKYHPKDRKSGEMIFDKIEENLYGAYEIKDGVLSITDKYKDMVTEETENYTAALLQDISRRLDGSLTGTEKTRLHRDMFGSAILLHRNYLLWGLQERFHGKMFRYDKGIESSGMYSWSNIRKMPSAIYSMLLSKIRNIVGIYGENDFKQKFSVSERYNASRIFNEYIAFMAMAALAIIINKSMGDDDDDDDRKNSLTMLAYILTLRTMVEVGALSSPVELYNLQSSPTAAQSNIREIKNIIDMVSDGSMYEEVSSGIYEGKTKLFRSMTRLTPFYKHAYPMFIEPDYRNDERFMRSNVGSTYDVMENLMWPNNIKAQRRAKKEESAIKEETRIEKINRLYPGGYEAYKKKKEEREARKKEIRRRRNTK